jgi:hypothetical protein
MSTEDLKDTIYIDVDEEITGIIDKIQESDKKVVALVLPKRASVFQSIVNLKLLKRAAEKKSQNLVLITSEPSILPIAGAVGIHVAKTPHSKPEIPAHPDSVDQYEDESMHLDNGKEFDPKSSKEKAVGELAAASGVALTEEKIHKPEDIDETIDISDESLIDDATGKGENEPSKSKKSKKNKKDKKDSSLKVPDFNKFRKILIIGGIVFASIIVLFFLFGNLLNKATITIQTTTQPVNSSITLNLDTAAKSLNTANSTVPAVAQSTQKSSSQSVPTTGQVNNGNKATGNVTLSSVYCSSQPPSSGPPSLPANSGVTSNGVTYLTQSSTTFSSKGTFYQGCTSFAANDNTSVIAQSGGSNGNLSSGSSFKVPGSGYGQIQGTNSNALSGGTDNMVNAVSQNDINAATQKIGSQDTSSVKTALENQLKQAGLVPIVGTFNTGTANTVASPTLGSAGNQVTVTQTVTYTMLGVQQSYLSQLVTNSVNQQINPAQQSIVDDGVSTAQYNVIQSNGTTAQVTMQATASVGAKLDTSTIKHEVAGKKTADVEATIKSNPGVTNVTVKLSPFWVSSVPTDQKKIIINITKS